MKITSKIKKSSIEDILTSQDGREQGHIRAFIYLDEKLDDFRNGFNRDIERVHERIDLLSKENQDGIHQLDKSFTELIGSIASMETHLERSTRELIEAHEKDCKSGRDIEKEKANNDNKNKRDNRTKIIIALIGLISTISAVVITFLLK